VWVFFVFYYMVLRGWDGVVFFFFFATETYITQIRDYNLGSTNLLNHLG
jgi:hypothetical protein